MNYYTVPMKKVKRDMRLRQIRYDWACIRVSLIRIFNRSTLTQSATGPALSLLLPTVAAIYA